MLTYVLTHWGAETQSSASVAEALSRVTEWQPNILLTDINMPGEDGYELLTSFVRCRPKAAPKFPPSL
jgi:CheY-like chemotaxis protein